MSLLTRLPALCLLLLAFMAPQFAHAHSPDQSYIYLRIYKDAMGGRFEMTAKDMNKALGLGLPDRMTQADIAPFIDRVHEYLISRSNFSANGKNYPVRFTETNVLNLEEMEDFVRFNFDFDNVDEVPAKLDIDYSVLFDKDDKHRGVLIVEHNWKAGILDNEALFANIFDPNNTSQELSLEDASVWKGFVALVKLGIWHIYIGLDHILFVIALILPAVVRRREDEPTGKYGINNWEPVKAFKPAFLYIIKIVTFFTIAHSITLALATLDIVTLPSRLVESIIAFSIALAAFHNIIPIFKSREWIIAFGFGLFHGFGFASVLGEKGLGGDFMIYSLLGFNIGVEIGQLLIICAAFPILYLMRKSRFYPKFITWGSVLLIIIALHWVLERGFDMKIPIVGTLAKVLGI